MFIVTRHDLPGRGPERFFWKKVVNYTQIHEFLCLLEPILG